jgi:hypothetical protein
MTVVPGVFSEPVYEPVMTAEKLAKFKETEEYLADVARVKSHHESAGREWSDANQAWSTPDKED